MSGLVKVIKDKHGNVIEWKGLEVFLKISGATADALEATAFSVEGKAKQLIVEHDQVDTGFMLNSIYAVGQGSKELDNYYKALSEAKAQNGDANFLGREQPPDDGMTAIVAAGAEYAIFQELINSFLYAALQQEASDFGGTLIEKVKNAT